MDFEKFSFDEVVSGRLEVVISLKKIIHNEWVTKMSHH
jgi:hypothetical protein